MADETFLGVGWKFPVGLKTNDKDNVTRVATARYEQSIQQSIMTILGTARGERIMRPAFGADLQRLVFAPNNSATAGMAMYYVREALTQWEPRITLLTVDANPDPDEPDRLLITIEYQIVATDTAQNLVYPFYLGRA